MLPFASGRCLLLLFVARTACMRGDLLPIVAPMTGNEGQPEASASQLASELTRRWLSTADVSRQTGFSYISVSRAAVRGDLDGHKVRGVWRFSQQQVDAWIQGSTKRGNRVRAAT